MDWVYRFDELHKVEKRVGVSRDHVKELLGGKGANLAEMYRLGLRVPPGVIITSAACVHYFSHENTVPDGLVDQIRTGLAWIELQSGKKLGDPQNPLLLSCRSGAKVSMPGMMDTVLNIGLNEVTAEALLKLTHDERFVWDSFRRFVAGFGSVVLGVPDEAFETPLAAMKQQHGYLTDLDVPGSMWRELTTKFKAIITSHTGLPFPENPWDQIYASVLAVFKSWNSKRAITYRRHANISDSLGTAVSLVAMVFGNMGPTSGTAVVFSRNPLTGENCLYGDFLANAQGEDVVAGIRTPLPIAKLADILPECYNQLLEISSKLETHFCDMQDMELTIENATLYMLQTRDAKRTAAAAVKTAVDMVHEKLITKEQAIKRISPHQIDDILHPQFDPKELERARKDGRLVVTGVNASPGAGVGRVYLDADLAEERVKKFKEDVILVRQFTKPDDIHGILLSKGVLTAEGGATSHAAVVSRQFGIPAVCGASALEIDMDARHIKIGTAKIMEGDWVSLDGGAGEVFLGEIPTQRKSFQEQHDLITLLEFADEISNSQNGMFVMANADTGTDATRAKGFGARGIGLCRTEHMFFLDNRLPIVQQMILAKSQQEREAALATLLPMQITDFEDLFTAMDGNFVTIRLLDPPLHEFLPSEVELVESLAQLRASKSNSNLQEINRVDTLLHSVMTFHESNPMLGLRGVRLSIVMPEIAEMQIHAIFKAAANVRRKGKNPLPRIMIPLTGEEKELAYIQPRLEAISKEVLEAEHLALQTYEYGTMIETPRGALISGDLAKRAQFFSFGTNDLTQMTFGYSRDDAEREFLMTYIERGILPNNPFKTVDPVGVGRLMEISIKEGRLARPNLSVGVCGEHAGDPASIQYFHQLGIDYVSCSPYRVPIARLSCAHAALAHARAPSQAH